MDLLPGDIACTRSKSRYGWLIRIGAALSNSSANVNHVVVVSHKDEAGTLWGIEGRPGGVGWVDMARYDSPWTVTNVEQPKSDAQRAHVVEVCKGLLGTPYDWTGIVLDAMEAIGVQQMWARKWAGDDKAPGHVVCSSLLEVAYTRAGLASPGGRYDRTVTPGDWAAFITEKRWL